MKKRILPIAGIIIGLFLLIVLVNLILKTPNSLAAQDNDWIGFYGAIIGGMITLIGVYASIKYDLFNQKEIRRSEWLPVLNCDKSAIYLRALGLSIEKSVTGLINIRIADKEEQRLPNKYIQRYLVLELKNHGQILFDLEIIFKDKTIFRRDMIVAQSSEVIQCQMRIGVYEYVGVNESFSLDFKFKDYHGNTYIQRMDVEVYLTYIENTLPEDDYFKENDGKTGVRYRIEQVIEMKKPIATI